MPSADSRTPLPNNWSDVEFGPIPMVRVEGHGYCVDLGKKDDHLICHFFPNTPDEVFHTAMEDALIDTFKFEDKMEAAWEDDMRAWSVRVKGVGRNPMLNDLAADMVACLSSKLFALNYPADLPDVSHSPID